MVKTKIEYDINYRKYCENLFSKFDGSLEIVEEIMNDIKLNHIIYTLIGYDANSHGQIHHISEQYRIYDVDSQEELWCNDERIEYCLKRLIWDCQDHYTSRNDKTLKKNGITYKITKYEV